MEQTPNAYLDRWITFRHLFVRKIPRMKYSGRNIAIPTFGCAIGPRDAGGC